MESIISPWFIYLLSLLDNFGVGFIFVVFALCIMYVGLNCFINEDINFESTKDHIKAIKLYPVIWIFLASVLLVCVIPTQKTVIAMYVANKVTYERVSKTIDITKDLKESLKRDFMDIVQSLKQQEEE